jgi:hypothetical protein
MSIQSIANSIGQTVTLYEPTEIIDSVGSPVKSYSEGVERKAYVSNAGNTTQEVYGRDEGVNYVRVYFPEHVAIGADWILKYDNDLYRITSIQNPGMRKTGRLAYTCVDAQSDPGANIGI